MSKTYITINLTIEDDKIVDMDIVKNSLNRTEYVLDEVDEPMSKTEVITEITEYLKEV